MKYFLLIFLVFIGCMVGPKYQEPDMSLPCCFEESNQCECSDTDLYCWWGRFGDPLLDSLIAEAIASNHDLQIAIEKIEQTRAQYRIERSYLWPEIDLDAIATRSKISQNLFPKPSTPLPGGATFFPKFLDMFRVGFDAIWELDIWGKFRHGKNAAYYTLESTVEDSRSVMISLISEVAVNYVNIRAIQKKIELANRLIATDEAELAIAKKLYDVGVDNQIQVTTLISNLEADRSTIPVLRTSLKQSIYALAILLGREPEGLAACLQESGPIPPGSGRVPVGLPSELLRRRPDIRSAERQLAAATELVGAAIADFFPHIGLTGLNIGAGDRIGSNVGWLSNKLGKLFEAASRTFSVGVGINWSLIDFGRIRGHVDVQKSLQRQALLNYEQTVLLSLKDVESALVAYFEEENRHESLKNRFEADRRTLEITEGLNCVGIANELQVLQAQKVLINSENAYIDSEQALTGDLVAIYKAIGGDWNLPDSAEECPCQ
ncbi:MAG: efflux transporter outer membrane subunit [Verrucomicrobia bacterium]|nr:efflux transporter outer membrane subunit [Verrucomicrobiota bacterium]